MMRGLRKVVCTVSPKKYVDKNGTCFSVATIVWNFHKGRRSQKRHLSHEKNKTRTFH